MTDVAEHTETEQRQQDKQVRQVEQLRRILRRGIASSQQFQRAVDKMPGGMIKREPR